MYIILSTYRGIVSEHVYLIVPLGLLFGWMLSFPLGQGLNAIEAVKGLDPNMLFKVFLLSHFTGLVFFGFTLDKIPFKKGLLILSLIVPVLYTAGLYLIPQNYTALLTGSCGFLITPFIINWTVNFVNNTDSSYRSRVMALTIILANIILFINTLLISVISIVWLALSGLIPPLIIMGMGIRHSIFERINIDNQKTSILLSGGCHADVPRFTGSLTSFKGILSFLFILFIFYLTAGYVYGEMFEKHYNEMGPLIFSCSILPYLAAAFLAGYLGDFTSRKVLVYTGLSCLGASIVCFSAFSGLWGFFLSEISIQVAYAFFDIFLWTALADATQKFSTAKVYGVGLGLNVFFIFIGINLNDYLGLYNFRTLMPILILSLIFVGVTVLLGLECQSLPKKQDRVNLKGLPQEKLTSREKEVALLVIKGKSNKEISAELFLSENTVKTHIRNILRKCDAPNKLKLLAKINDSRKN